MPIHPSGAVIARTGVGPHASVSIAAGRRAGARGQGKAWARSRQASLPRLSKLPVAPARGDPPLWVPVSRKLQGATSPDALRAGWPRPPAGRVARPAPFRRLPPPLHGATRGQRSRRSLPTSQCRLPQDELRVQGPGRLDRREYVDHVSWSDAEGVQPGDNLRKTRAAGDLGQSEAFALLDRRPGSRHDDRLAFRERVGLYDQRLLFDAKRKVALRNSDPGDLHVPTHHDRPRTLVNDHPGADFRLYGNVLDETDRMRGRECAGGAHVERDGARIEHQGHRSANGLVYRGLDPARSGEVGRSEREPDRREIGEREIQLPLDPRPSRDASRGRNTFDHAGAVTLRRDPSCHDWPLGDGIDQPVGGVERRHDKRPAQKARGIADGRYRDVDPASRPGERWQRRGCEDRRHVARPELLAGYVHPQAFEDVRHDLLRERRVAQPVPGPVESDHETVADKVVAPDTIELDKILDPDLGGGGSGQQN